MEKVASIARNTFRESIRSKVLYSLLLFAVLIVGLSAFLGTVTIGDPLKVIKDFGLFSISIFTVAYAVISGSTLLHKELNRRTVFNILSRPVRRWEFLVGKFCGLLLTATAMLVLMGAAFLLFVFFFQRNFDWLLLVAYFHIFLELIILCAATIFFSSIVVTPVLIGIFSFGIFLAGRSAALLLQFPGAEESTGAVGYFLKGFYALLPHLHKLNISDLVVFGVLPSGGQVLWSVLYALGYSAALLALANLAFARREFH